MNKHLIIVGLIIIIVLGVIMLVNVFASSGTSSVSSGYVPEEGFVPDETTAIKIAEAIWVPIYGNNIYKKQPFISEYDKRENCWIVKGTLSPNTTGGIPIIKISKENGTILYVYHSK